MKMSSIRQKWVLNYTDNIYICLITGDNERPWWSVCFFLFTTGDQNIQIQIYPLSPSIIMIENINIRSENEKQHSNKRRKRLPEDLTSVSLLILSRQDKLYWPRSSFTLLLMHEKRFHLHNVLKQPQVSKTCSDLYGPDGLLQRVEELEAETVLLRGSLNELTGIKQHRSHPLAILVGFIDE